jgi:hypothetical protein
MSGPESFVMNNKKSGAITSIDGLNSNSWLDHARTALLAAVQAIPVVGGPLGQLLCDYLPSAKHARCVRFLNELARDFEQIKDQLDQQVAASEDFGLMVEHVIKQVAETSEQAKGKLKAYRAVLLNSCKPSAPDVLRSDYFLGLLGRLKEIGGPRKLSDWMSSIGREFADFIALPADCENAKSRSY